ncbi:MAG: TonB-dependent receptor [Deltaproteobacteria bacterium]|nr:MAG: TonB-dependent receptor [Deltaproteobacteria bacterium]
MKRIGPFIFIFLHLLSSISLAQEEFEEEEAIFRFEEYVVTAARKVQRIEEAPAAVTVVTDEDIRQSGLNSIPEILRQVAGLDVFTLTEFDSQVNVRGYSGGITNRLLVLMDGRSVYEDFFGCVFWESLPIQLEDIKRIEIIKGPGSVMYGANAFSGVVNIITKSPEESRGGLFSVTDGWFNGSGQINHYIRSLIYAGEFSDLGYKVTGGWEQASQFGDHDETSEEITRGTTQLTYRIGDSSTATLEAGISDGKGEPFVYRPRATGNFQESYVKANYDYSNFKAQTFFRDGKIDIGPELWGIEPIGDIFILDDVRADYYTYDLELQQTVELHNTHSLMGGFNYRYFTLNSNYTEEKGLNTYAGFLQYEVKLIHNVIINLGIRMDYQDYIKERTTYSPRGSLIFTPFKDHTFRFSVGRAFRNPTYIDLFADVSVFDYVYVIGNKDLKPERVTSYDLGYQTSLFSRVRFKLDLFYYEMEDFIDTFGGRIEEPLALVMTTPNATGKATGIGGEAGLNYQITPWLSGLINYSHQYITDKDESIRRNEPRNKLNLGLRAELLDRISANLLIHYVGAIRRRYIIEFLLDEFKYTELDHYVLLNASVSCRLIDDRVEFTMSGQNLLDYENYKGKLYNDPGTDSIPLRVSGSLRVRF